MKISNSSATSLQGLLNFIIDYCPTSNYTRNPIIDISHSSERSSWCFLSGEKGNGDYNGWTWKADINTGTRPSISLLMSKVTKLRTGEIIGTSETSFYSSKGPKKWFVQSKYETSTCKIKDTFFDLNLREELKNPGAESEILNDLKIYETTSEECLSKYRIKPQTSFSLKDIKSEQIQAAVLVALGCASAYAIYRTAGKLLANKNPTREIVNKEMGKIFLLGTASLVCGYLAHNLITTANF